MLQNYSKRFVRYAAGSGALLPILSPVFPAPVVQKPVQSAIVVHKPSAYCGQTEIDIYTMNPFESFDDPINQYKQKTYELNNTRNVFHVDCWELFTDFKYICQSYDIYHVKRFYELFVKTYAQRLDSYSEGTRTFYDSGWSTKTTLTYDIHHRYMNYLFRELIHENKHISKDLLVWFHSLGVIDKGHYHCALNVLCSTGGFETAKLMHSIRPFDFKWKPEKDEYHLDYFRSAVANNHLEMVKWLYELGAHKDYKFGYGNILKIANERSNTDMKTWLKSLPEFQTLLCKNFNSIE
jgi:hypothetical protein